MKKLTLISLIALLLTSCFSKHKVFDPAALQARWLRDASKMTFAITTPGRREFKNDSILMNMEFKNQSDKTIKILDQFDDLAQAFSFRIILKTGYAIAALGPQIIDFDHTHVFKYIYIKPGKTYTRMINISEIIKNKRRSVKPNEAIKDDKLIPGTYQFRMSYYSDYGEDCLRGQYDAPPVDITIVN